MLIPQWTLQRDADYLSLLSRKIFHAGFSPALVDKRWPAFEAAFAGFEPPAVAAMTDGDVIRLSADATLIPNRRKLMATVLNARHFCSVASAHGTWMAWLHSLRAAPYAVRADTLSACLSGAGPATVFYFLLEAGEATPDDKPEHVRWRSRAEGAPGHGPG